MEENKATTGLKATVELHLQFTQLLNLLGHKNLLYDPTTNSNPARVPDACEETNFKVEEVMT